MTYTETLTHWRRLTISLDHRNAPKGWLKEELQKTSFQRDKARGCMRQFANHSRTSRSVTRYKPETADRERKTLCIRGSGSFGDYLIFVSHIHQSAQLPKEFAKRSLLLVLISLALSKEFALTGRYLLKRNP
jgi:hypothetical protein